MRLDGQTIKFSSKCGYYRCGRKALKRLNGNGYDSYCREHKREMSREYMRKRRQEDPSYGQGRYHDKR